MTENAIQTSRPAWMNEELDMFADAVDRFVRRECVPHIASWREMHQVPRETWLKAGEAGLLMASAPDIYGGGGGNFGHEAIIIDRLGYHDAAGMIIGVQMSVVRTFGATRGVN